LEKQATQRERERAEASLRSGLDAVREMVIRFGNEGLADAPEMQAMQQEILEDAERYLNSFVGFENNPALQRELGLALRSKGNVQSLLGKNKEADASYREAIEIQQGLVDREPSNAQYQVDLGATWNELGRLHGSSNATLALDALEKAVALIEPWLGEVPGCDATLADVFNTYANVQAGTGAIQPAIEKYQRSLSLRDRALARSPESDAPHVRHGMAMVHTNLGNLQQTHGQIDLARESYNSALQVWENAPDDLVVKRRYNWGLQSVYIALGVLHQGEGLHVKAEEYLRKGFEVREELARLYPDVLGHQTNVADGHHHLGVLLQTTNRFEAAHQEYKKAVDIYDDLVVRFPDDVHVKNLRASSYLNLALLQHQLGLLDEAHQNFVQVQKALESIAEENPRITQYHVALAAHEVNHARFLRDAKGLVDESLAMHQRAIDRLEPLYAQDPTNTDIKEKLLNAHGGRANTLIALSRYDEAVKHRNRMVELAPAASRDTHRMARALILARVDHAFAVEEAKSLAKLEGLMNFDFYNFACVCSLAATTARADAQLAVGDEIVREYVRQGLAYLETARIGGAFNSPEVVQALKTDSDLDALRGEEEFEQLLQKVDAE